VRAYRDGSLEEALVHLSVRHVIHDVHLISGGAVAARGAVVTL
jgi:hypothetical protein